MGWKEGWSGEGCRRVVARGGGSAHAERQAGPGDGRGRQGKPAAFWALHRRHLTPSALAGLLPPPGMPFFLPQHTVSLARGTVPSKLGTQTLSQG